MFDFTARKFLRLNPEQQHKKCVEVLRALIEEYEDRVLFFKNYEIYRQLELWLQLAPAPLNDPKQLADRFHEHLRLADQKLKEHRLLLIKKTDRSQAEETWDISIYLDHIRSAHNVGSILRTTEAFRLGKVYFSEQTPSITHKQVQDTAMGCADWIESERCGSLAQLPAPYIALETSEQATPLYDFTFPERFTLIIGNEEYGCSDVSLQLADQIIEIPLRGKKNSLNVANAFAITAAEIQRQKLTRSIHD